MSDLDVNSPATTTAPSPAAPVGLQHGGPLTAFVKEISGPLHLGNPQTAAALVAARLGQPGPIKNDLQAHVILTSFLQFLLDQQRYIDAATLLWKPTMFSGEPAAVRRMWDAMFTETAIMIPGAASMGKSYSLGVWMMLDWLRDPNYTNIQVVGPSEKHLEKNLFSHLVKLHRGASIPLPGDIRELEITCDPKQKDSGIFGVVVPIGKRSSGRLQGVKVVLRPTVHLQFGPTSRVRVVLEEAENIPVGIWEDVTNILANTSGLERFKIACPFNPKDPNSPCAVRCEPVGGWFSLDVETSMTWVSKRGWRVVRLDGYTSENVLLGHEVYFGLQTKSGLEAVIKGAGGHGTPGYYTMARGWYPPTGVDLAVIPQHLMNDVYGVYTFVDTPKPCAGVDVALDGGDNAIMVLGRTGMSSGWRRPPVDGKESPFIPFLDASGNRIRRPVIQVDQIFTLPKGDTTKLVHEIKRVCSNAGIRSQYLAVDRAGNGAGVHDVLAATPLFTATRGINGSESATERRIVEEDQKLACDEYQDLLSELWFAVRKFIEYGLLKFAPGVPQDPLVSELTGRHMKLGGKKTKVEPKKEYKSRGNKSPDRADGLTILVHGVRLNSDGPPSATGQPSTEDDGAPYEAKIGITDRQDYL